MINLGKFHSIVMLPELVTFSLFASTAIAAVGKCPIDADFFVSPTVLEDTIHFGDISVNNTIKRSVVRGALVQIECTEVDPILVFPGLTDEAILRNYAQFWSISPVENGNGGISDGHTPRPHKIMAGTKEISGISITYTYRLFKFRKSFAMVATGSPTNTNDKRSLENFVASITIDPEVEHFDEDAKAAGRRSHMASCIPAIESQNRDLNLGMSQVEIAFYCSCLGIAYFDAFTMSEIEELSKVPSQSVRDRQEAIRTKCFDQARQ